MKEIQLTQGQVALVDDADFEFLNQWKWYALWCADTQSFYARRKSGKWPNQDTIIMARLIMNTPKGLYCDHVDHDTLNNQRFNLRNVTGTQNSMNRKGPQANNVLGVLGVQREGNGFRGHIYINGKQIRFPTRATIEEAITDRKNAEEKYYNEFCGNK